MDVVGMVGRTNHEFEDDVKVIIHSIMDEDIPFDPHVPIFKEAILAN